MFPIPTSTLRCNHPSYLNANPNTQDQKVLALTVSIQEAGTKVIKAGGDLQLYAGAQMAKRTLFSVPTLNKM